MTTDAGLRQLFQRHLPTFHWQSVESWSTGQGVPDVNYCFAGAEGWIEMKRVNGWRCNIEPEQIAWLERRARAGGRVFIAARRVAHPQSFWLLHGTDARQLVAERLTAVAPLVFCHGPPGAWQWPAIAKVLTS